MEILRASTQQVCDGIEYSEYKKNKPTVKLEFDGHFYQKGKMNCCCKDFFKSEKQWT